MDTNDIWAAAFAAYRVNGGYYKVGSVTLVTSTRAVTPNMILMREFCDGKHEIKPEDYDAAERAKEFVRGYALTILMTGKLSDLRNEYLKLVEQGEVGWQHGRVAWFPQFIEGEYNIAKLDNLVKENGDTNYLGRVGERVSFTGRVVKSNYSYKYNTTFVTVVTNENKVCWFAFAKPIVSDKDYLFTGTVKRNTDECQSQMSRVKIVSE